MRKRLPVLEGPTMPTCNMIVDYNRLSNRQVMRELLPAYVCVVIAVFDVDLSLSVRVFVEFVYYCDFFQ